MEPKNQIETRIIQELTANFKLSDILKVTKFPKSTYHYWVNKMKQVNPDQELEELILIIFRLCFKLVLIKIKFRITHVIWCSIINVQTFV